MNKKHLFWIIPFFIFLGFILGFLFVWFGEGVLMGEYDLYNCIYHNADANGFNQNPIMIQKIQDECICFREHNYTNLMEVDCSEDSGWEMRYVKK